MEKISLFLLSIVLITGCAPGSTNDHSISTRSCKTPLGLTSGCCSNHGGFGDQCASGQAQYVDETGQLVCNDNTLSPTCTY